MKLNFSNEAMMAFNNNKDEVMAFSKMLLDTAIGNKVEYSKEDANAIIKAKFNEVLGFASDEKPRGKDLRKAIRRHKVDIFELIEETIETMLIHGFSENPFFQEFVDSKNISEGDANIFHAPDESLLVVSEFSGNHHDLLRQKLGFGQEFSVKTSWYGVKIYREFEELVTGKVDWSTLVEKIYKAFDKKVTEMLYGAFATADSTLPNVYTKRLTLSAQTKGDVLDMVEDISLDTGDDIVVAGTRSALSKLIATTTDAQLSDAMKDEKYATGGLGMFEGIKLMVVPQAKDASGKKIVDNSKLWVLPVSPDFKFIKFVNEGEGYFNEATDRETNMDMSVEAEYMQKFGIATVLNKAFGVITIE